MMAACPTSVSVSSQAIQRQLLRSNPALAVVKVFGCESSPSKFSLCKGQTMKGRSPVRKTRILPWKRAKAQLAALKYTPFSDRSPGQVFPQLRLLSAAGSSLPGVMDAARGTRGESHPVDSGWSQLAEEKDAVLCSQYTCSSHVAVI